MGNTLKNKKIWIVIVVLCIFIFIAVIIGIVLNKDEDVADINQSGQEIIVHKTNEDTVEEKAEGGLTESDSEDGPMLNEDNMIDFYGNEVTDNNNPSQGNEDADSGENREDDSDTPSEDDKKEEEEGSEDTGSWGNFY